MSASVSVIMPVRNLQSTVRERVFAVAEILAELASDFRILIVDYGSTDETPEIAFDLSHELPQVEVLARPRTERLYDAVESGLLHTGADIVFVHDPRLPIRGSAFQQLWALRNDSDLVMAQSRAGHTTAEASLVTASGFEDEPAVQMIRRTAIADLLAKSRRVETANPLVERVMRRDMHDGSTRQLPKLLTRLKQRAT